jgi:prophage regulatory protein
MMRIAEIPALEEILRRADLPRYTGLQRTQVDDLIKQGKFPRPVRLSERRIGWLAREVAAWQASRIAARDKTEAA